jgi:hypothetical protein
VKHASRSTRSPGQGTRAAFTKPLPADESLGLSGHGIVIERNTKPLQPLRLWSQIDMAIIHK